MNKVPKFCPARMSDAAMSENKQMTLMRIIMFLYTRPLHETDQPSKC